MASLLVLLTIGVVWIGALGVWLAGNKRPRILNLIAVSTSLISAAAALLLLFFATSEPVLQFSIGGLFGTISFVPDGLGVFLAAVATVIGSLAVIFSVDYMHGDDQLARYYSFVLLFIGAMAGLVLTANLFMLLFFWELVALCSYALIAFHSDDPKAVSGGIRAIVVTQLGGIGLIIGVLLIVGYTGNYDLNAFLASANQLPPDVLRIVAFGFLMAAAAKSAQVPFHIWLPGAMEAPTPVSALIHAATMVNAGVYLIVRFYPAFVNVPGWTDLIILIGVISALAAALMALVSTDLKRVLAYSTISQLGFMFYAVGVGGLFASQFHLMSHAVFKALLFLGAGAIIHIIGTRDLAKMGGLGRHMPLVRTVFIVGALALAGLPILNGFWSKDLILESGLAAGPRWALYVMLGGVGLTALYTMRLVWLVFFGQRRGKGLLHDASLIMRIPLLVLTAGTLVTWVLVGRLGQLLESTLPLHHLDTLRLSTLVTETFAAPLTWSALLIVAIGIGLWVGRRTFARFTDRLAFLARLAASDFGFEWLVNQINAGAQHTAEVLRRAQTGQVNWNLFGIAAGLLLTAAFLVLSGS